MWQVKKDLRIFGDVVNSGEEEDFERLIRVKDVLENLLEFDKEIKESEEERIAGLCGDNRNFLTLTLGGEEYKTLLDPGATLSLIGPRVVEKFKDKLKKNNSFIKTATGKISKTLGVLDTVFEIEGISRKISLKGMEELDYDIILGMDFCLSFDVDIRLGKGQWRTCEGEWHRFLSEDKEEKLVVHAECAGISELNNEERRVVEELVERILEKESSITGLTNLTEHRIDVIDL